MGRSEVPDSARGTIGILLVGSDECPFQRKGSVESVIPARLGSGAGGIGRISPANTGPGWFTAALIWTPRLYDLARCADLGTSLARRWLGEHAEGGDLSVMRCIEHLFPSKSFL